MLGLGNTLIGGSGSDFEWGNSGYLVFDGVDDKADVSVSAGIITSLTGGSGNIGQNFTVSMWIKPTWTTSGSGGAFAPKNVFPLYIGKVDDVWESIRAPYYQLTNSGGAAQNKLWADIRSSTGGNNKKNDSVALHDYNAIFGTGTGTDDYWESGNPSGGAWVHIVAARAGAKWSLFWNGTDLTETGVTNNSLSIDNTIARVVSFGYTPQNDTYWPLGIRDCAIFSAALTAGNVTTLYNSGVFLDVRKSGIDDLEIYYPFNENVRDIVGGHNLTLTGGTFTAL